MDALRNSKKISLLAVAILFLFTFFTFHFSPRTLTSHVPLTQPLPQQQHRQHHCSQLTSHRDDSQSSFPHSGLGFSEISQASN
jgi:hypothetical protein